MADNPFMHPDLNEPELEELGQPQEPKLWAGKYKDEMELERGYDNLFKEGQKLVSRVQELESQLAARASDPWGDRVAERTDPGARSASRHNPEEVLNTAGVPVDELRELIRREAQREVQEGIQPFFQGAQARQSVAQDYPEFTQFEGELAQFVESNPTLKARYSRAYSSDPEVALKWVFGEFQKVRGMSPHSNGNAAGDQQAAARLDAMLPGRVASPRGVQTDSAEEYKKIYERALQTGDWGQVLNWKLSGTVPEAHYKGLQG